LIIFPGYHESCTFQGSAVSNHLKFCKLTCIVSNHVELCKLPDIIVFNHVELCKPPGIIILHIIQFIFGIVRNIVEFHLKFRSYNARNSPGLKYVDLEDLYRYSKYIFIISIRGKYFDPVNWHLEVKYIFIISIRLKYLDLGVLYLDSKYIFTISIRLYVLLSICSICP